MAEATAFRNNALPYPVYGVPYTIVFPLLDADGDPVTGATCDSEVSINGDTGADCTNEGTEITFTTTANKGQYYLTLTAAEMTGDIITVNISSATSKATVVVLYPRKLVELASGTSQGGAAGYITLAAGAVTVNDQYNGCLCVATIDTNIETRILQDCTASNQQCTVTPSWNVAPDADDTYKLYLPEGRQLPTAEVNTKTGFVLSDAGVDAIFDRNSSLSISFETLINRIYQISNNKTNITNATGILALRAIGDGSTIATGAVSDNLTTSSRAELTWA